MKRFILLLGFMSVLLGGASLLPRVASAEAEAPMTEAHITRIRNNCVEAQSSLSQLHTSDALLRVNRGQLYESISTKLMAPLNSRIALNKLDGASLVSTTVSYETTLDKFRSDYQRYDETLSKALDINCVNQPVSFYDSVQLARDERKKVHADIVSLQALIERYKANFETFAAKTLKDNQ